MSESQAAVPRRRSRRWWPTIVTFIVLTSTHYDSDAAWTRWVFGGRAWDAGGFEIWHPGVPVMIIVLLVFLRTNRSRGAEPAA